jgi:predicted ATP-grasp superfamily ATP-dependent carboligase
MMRARLSGFADSEVPAVVYPDSPAALGVCRALGAYGVPVIVVTANSSTPGQYSHHTRRVVFLPGAREPRELVASLSKLGQEFHRPPVLFLADDAALLALSPHRVALEQWFRFPSAPWPVLHEMMLKDRLYDALAGIVPVPRTVVPSAQDGLAAAASVIGYPAIVKPLLRCLVDSSWPAAMPFERCFGAKAVRVRTWNQLQDTYAAASGHGFPVLVQEEIEGPISALYSLGVYVTRAGDVAAAFTSRKLSQVPADFGDGLIVQATRAPELQELGVRALKHFGYHGIADIEFKWDARAGVFKLLDINPRPWPWIHLPTACGVNLPYAAYLDALDRPVKADHFVQRDFETRWLSATGLLTFTARSLRAARPDRLLTVLRQARQARVGMFSTEDPLLRMYTSPGYWMDSFRRATAWFRDVPREAASVPLLARSGRATVAGRAVTTGRNHDA